MKWLLPEPGSDAAQELLESGEQLIAPALIRVEVAAAIGRRVRLSEIDRLDGEAAFFLWLQCLAKAVVELVPDEQYLSRAWAIAMRLKHPLQDCLYLAVAEGHKAAMVTADKKFAAKVVSGKRIRLLGS